jgi:competence protein ComEC
VAATLGRADALGDETSLWRLPVWAAAAGWVTALAWFGLRRRGGREKGRRLVALAVVLLLPLSFLRGSIGAERDRGPALEWDAAGEWAGWVSGRVVSDPRAARGGTRFVLEIEDSEPFLPVAIRASLWADSVSGTPRFTSEILAYVELHRPRRPSAPGGFDELRWLNAQGAAAAGRIRGAAWREVSSPPPGLNRPLVALRARWARRISVRVPGPAGEFLRGLVLGERGQVSPEIIDDFRRAGVLHLLALSGQHVALVAALLMAFCRLVGLGTRREAVASGVGVWAYAILTGLSPSVTRAALGSALHLLGRLLGRRTDGLEVLAWSAALPVLVSPRLGLHIGFQLSCLASAGLIAGAALQRQLRQWIDAQRLAADSLEPRRERWRKVQRRLESWLAGAFALPAATVAAQIAVLPILAGSFGAVSAVGLASNLVLVPTCVVLLSAALPLVVLDTMIPTPEILWRSVATLAAFALEAGEWFAGWPGARLTCSLPGWAAALAVMAALIGGLGWRLAAGWLRRSHRPPGAAYVAGASCAAAGIWLGLIALGFSSRPDTGGAAVHYWMLDVGQGDAQVLEFGDGRVWLVDVGDARRGFDAAARILVPFLRARGWRAIDCVVLTHEDGDHAGGWRSLIREFEVRRLVSGAETLTALRERGALAGWKGRTTVVSAGDTLLEGRDYLIRALWPPAGETGLSPNDRSVVLEIEAGGERMLLPGDVDSTIENRWVHTITTPVTALKLAHHGAGSSSGWTLIAAAAPRIALVSCGRKNRFGHPHPGTLDRIKQADMAIRRTDREGTVQLVFSNRRFSGFPKPRVLTPRP